MAVSTASRSAGEALSGSLVAPALVPPAVPGGSAAPDAVGAEARCGELAGVAGGGSTRGAVGTGAGGMAGADATPVSAAGPARGLVRVRSATAIEPTPTSTPPTASASDSAELRR